ncbi:MAG: hypothetical protein U1E59_18115 [Amaricoccus sp.]
MEAIANVAVGYGIDVGIQLVVFPVFSLTVSFRQNLAIGPVFAAESIFGRGPW